MKSASASDFCQYRSKILYQAVIASCVFGSPKYFGQPKTTCRSPDGSGWDSLQSRESGTEDQKQKHQCVWKKTRTEKQEKVQAGNQNPILPCTVTVSNSTHGRTRNLNSRSRNRVWLTVQGLLNRYYLTGKSRWSESTRRRWTNMSVLPISTISSRPSATTTTRR